MKRANQINERRGGTPGIARRRGFTLVEVLIAVVILAVVSTAIVTMIFGAMNDNRYLQNTGTAQSEIELAMRRITNNLREAQTGSITIGAHTIATLTQADSIDGYPSGATVSYALQVSTTTTGQKDLAETDQRYGTNVLVHNVTTFNAALVSGIANLYQIDVVVGTTTPEERHFKVLARNN